MKRDFTESARQELLQLVAETEREKWSDITDWIGDRVYDFSAWIGWLNIDHYLDKLREYQKKVIDKENATAERINEIFEAVNAVSDSYKYRFAGVLSALSSYISAIDRLAEVVEPSNGLFRADYISNGLTAAVNGAMQCKDSLLQIAQDGIDKEQISTMEPGTLQSVLDIYAVSLLDFLPDVKVGDKVEVPIGPNVSMYYSASAKMDGDNDFGFDLKPVLDHQRVELKSFHYKLDSGFGLSAEYDSEDGISASAEGDHSTVSISKDGVSIEYKIEIDANTYKVKYELNILEQELTMEESVTTKVDGGSATSAIGIKYTEGDNGWRPVKPISVPAYDPVELPSFDVDWDAVAAITAVTVIAVAATVVIIFAPEAAPVLVPVLAM